MNRRILKILVLSLLTPLLALGQKYQYDTVPGDALKAKIYTLNNGLRIYMSVNNDAPRIETRIAVRAGSKNDPRETTGLAHYFEHMLFKGTPQFGTMDYAAERPLLDQIEELYEVYRKCTDTETRNRIYHQIDSISYQASLFAIPNEYSKLMNTIGSIDTNAFTSRDATIFVENIPSNQLDNWAYIESLRLKYPVMRGFHTELETIYEEKNMTQASDQNRAMDKLMSILFPDHPYGNSLIGTTEHLLNPSISNVLKFHKQWYVPNNMAVILSGDFNPDEAVDIINKYFGDMTPNENLPAPQVCEDCHPQEVLVYEISGFDPQHAYIAWWLPAANHPDYPALRMMESIMMNGSTGLIESDLLQRQLVSGAQAGLYTLADQSMYIIAVGNNNGQSIDEAISLILGEVKKLAEGEYDQESLKSIINNMKLSDQRALASNEARAQTMSNSFIFGQDWNEASTMTEKMANLTKDDIIEVTNKYLKDNNFVVLLKNFGVDMESSKIEKPQITPIAINNDMSSPFIGEIRERALKPLKPVFADFDKDITKTEINDNVTLIYKQNTDNDLFDMSYVFDTGANADPNLDLASSYIPHIGTTDKNLQEIEKSFFDIGGSFGFNIDNDRTYVNISGLSEYMPQTLSLAENIWVEMKADQDAWNALAMHIIDTRYSNKNSQEACFNALLNFSLYGDDLIARKFTNDQLLSQNPEEIIDAVKALRNYPHLILYYGPMSEAEVIQIIRDIHIMPTTYDELPQAAKLEKRLTDSNIVYIAPFNTNQIQLGLYSNNGEKFDKSKEPTRTLYNQYLKDIIFQELRESRSLAYWTDAQYQEGENQEEPYIYLAGISTQSDKIYDAIAAFNQIINDMPQSQTTFDIVKNGIYTKLLTSRTLKEDVIKSWINCQDFGYDKEANQYLYESLPSLTLSDISDYQQKHIKGRNFTYFILGRIEDLDIEALQQIGKVIILDPKDIFGY